MCCIVAQEPASEKEDSGDGDTFARQAVMRLSVVTFMRPGTEPRGRAVGRIVDYARQIERRGFPGIWVTDSLGRGRPTLDPLVTLGALSVATQRVELGIPVLQVPLRHPIELAHRVQSVQALSGGRLRLGVGSGSTRADFDLLGADYDQRFRTLMRSLEIMRRAWSGEPVNGGVLSPWPGCEGGPPVLLGAWRNPRWIAYAAKQCAGWIASGLYSSWEDLEAGMRLYRDAGGKNAVLANVLVDLHSKPEPGSLAERATISLVCPPDEARVRLKRIDQLGFDEVLVVSPGGALDELERVRDFL
jgi:alkanesulfonate monooxygenase SsuD/methylene tetrahydromethanopterin reductase-like flavin-dependent oxidoreductase (luciferase family)